MSNGFSLVGYESVPISEYLPILENIKQDLKLIYDKFNANVALLETLNFETLRTNSNFSSAGTAERTINSIDVAVNTTSVQMDSVEGHRLYPECQEQMMEKLQKIMLLIPKIPESKDSDDSLDIFQKLELYFKSKKNDVDDSLSEKTSSNEEIGEYRKQLLEKDVIINEKNDEIEQHKEGLMRKDGKIENLEEHMKGLKDELSEKDQNIEKLIEDIKILESNQLSTINTEKEIKKPNLETKRILEEKIQKITELEDKINKFEFKEAENNENLEKIQELEEKIRQLEVQKATFIDDNYRELMNNLSLKRAEIRKNDKKIEELENENSDMENKIRRLEREMKILNIKSDELAQELQDSEIRKEEFEVKFKQLAKELREFKKQSTNEEETTKYLEEIKELNTKLKSKENLINEKDKIANEMKQKVADLQEKLKVKEKCLEEELEKKTLELEKQNTEIETLKRDNEKKQQAIATMREKIKSISDEKVDPHDIRKLNNQIKFKDMEIEQNDAKIINLKEAYESKSRECDLSKKEIIQLNAEIENMKKLHFAGRAATDTYKDNKQLRTKDSQFPEWWSNHMEKR